MHNGRPAYRKDSTNFLLFFVNETSESGPSRWIVEDGFKETEHGFIRYEGENNCPYDSVPFQGQTWSNVHAKTIVDQNIWMTCDLGNTATFITSHLCKSKTPIKIHAKYIVHLIFYFHLNLYLQKSALPLVGIPTEVSVCFPFHTME